MILQAAIRPSKMQFSSFLLLLFTAMTIGVLGTEFGKQWTDLPRELGERIAKPTKEHHEEIKRRRSERHDLKKKRKIRDPKERIERRSSAEYANQMKQKAETKLRRNPTNLDLQSGMYTAERWRDKKVLSEPNQARQKLQTMRATDGMMMGGNISADKKRDDVQRRRQIRKDLKKQAKIRDPAKKERLRSQMADANRRQQVHAAILRNDPTNTGAQTGKRLADRLVLHHNILPHKQARQQRKEMDQFNKKQHERWKAV
jgi:hypothetical protein